MNYTGNREAILQNLQVLFRRRAGRLPFIEVKTIAENIAGFLSNEQLLTMLLSTFALFALLISITGIAGLLSYAVQLRRKEIGIRLALGATPGAIQAYFQSYGAVLCAGGLGLGALVAYGARRALDAYLYRTQVSDPTLWIGAGVLMLVCASAASAIPAWRATRIDLVETLRID